MNKKAVLFSAGEYLDSSSFSKAELDLDGVKYDILALEKRLSQIGFSVEKKENILKADYLPVLAQSAKNSPSDAIHIVYFSGHGGHCNGQNYIYPSDFGILYDKNNNIDDAAINLEDIISIFKNRGRLILILDACRNEFDILKGYYSEMVASEEVYIAYGTMFQGTSTATSRLSWFTEAICDEILAPNIDIDMLFTRVRQNIFTKHFVQLPVSVSGLLDKVILNINSEFDEMDKHVYDFVEKYGDEYNDRYGYFNGEELIFIDASQYHNIGLLDTYWRYTKVQNGLSEKMGLRLPTLYEEENKLVYFLSIIESSEKFSFDMSHTWYYNGRQIRMGEIPPLPPSMQRKLPEKDKELLVTIEAQKLGDKIRIAVNLPDNCEVFINDDMSRFARKFKVSNGEIIINEALKIKRISINSGVFSEDAVTKDFIGNKNRNLTGKHIVYHPIAGNQIDYTISF